MKKAMLQQMQSSGTLDAWDVGFLSRFWNPMAPPSGGPLSADDAAFLQESTGHSGRRSLRPLLDLYICTHAGEEAAGVD